MNIGFSIIVPLYNSELFISDTIDSVITQTFSNWELILVDDGSVDSTSKIIDDYILKDSRVKYIKKEHSGQLETRQVGVRNATMEYLLFLDSDDMISPYLLSYLSDMLLKTKYDAIFYGFTRSLNELYKDDCDHAVEMEVIQVNKIIEFCFCNHQFRSLCFSCFKTSLALNAINSPHLLSFKSIRNEEDFLQLFYIILNCNRILYTTKSLYFYRENQFSISKQPTTQFLYEQIFIDSYIYKRIIADEIVALDNFTSERLAVLAHVSLKFIIYCCLNVGDKKEFRRYMTLVRNSFSYNEFSKNYKFGTKSNRIIIIFFNLNLFCICKWIVHFFKVTK